MGPNPDKHYTNTLDGIRVRTRLILTIHRPSTALVRVGGSRLSVHTGLAKFGVGADAHRRVRSFLVVS